MNHLTIDLHLTIALFAIGMVVLTWLGCKAIIFETSNNRRRAYIVLLVFASGLILVAFVVPLMAAQEWWR